MDNVALTSLTDFTESRIESMLTSPLMWGPLGCVELQILLLLETELFGLREFWREADIETVHDGFRRFLDERFPGSPPVSLVHRIGDDVDDPERVFVEVMRAFVQRARRSRPTPDWTNHPEAPIARISAGLKRGRPRDAA